MDGHSDNIERLIQRVRMMRNLGLDLDSIIDNCKDSLPPGMFAGEIILAWHAARILDGEVL
jgi:hypothetical protein